jgi:hypothetical protein
MAHSRGPVTATLSASVILAAVLLGCTTSADGEPDARNEPGEPRAREVYTFQSLDVMLATADAVAIATVMESRPGRSVGDAGAELTFTEITLAIDEVLMGRLGAEVVLEIDTQQAWANPGQQAVFVLHEKEDRTPWNYHRPLNSQSVFVLDGESLAATNEGALSASIAQLGLGGLRLEIARVLPLIRAGQVQPAETLPRSEN